MTTLTTTTGTALGGLLALALAPALWPGRHLGSPDVLGSSYPREDHGMRRLVVGSVCAAMLAAGSAAFARESASVPRFEPAPCPDLLVPELAKASCGYLVVPENRDQPTGRTIRLIVAILPAESPRPGADPVVYLSGGPGGIALFEIPFLIRSGLNWDHDLVVMNQRGTYLSQPALTCESADAFARRLIGLRFYSKSTKRAHLAATRGCRQEVLAKGAVLPVPVAPAIDLSAYNSRESAADFADLRRVLGYDRWNVFGVSYGTYLAQTLMRDHPEGIRSVILDSTVPVRIVTLPRFWHTAREGFDNLFRACEAETACRERAPGLKITFTRLVREFEARPRRVLVANPQGKATKVMLDGGVLIDCSGRRPTTHRSSVRFQTRSPRSLQDGSRAWQRIGRPRQWWPSPSLAKLVSVHKRQAVEII